MKTRPQIEFPANSRAVGILLCAGAAAAASLFAPQAFGDSQDSSAFKTEVSRTAVTTMPAFKVEESPSDKTHTLFMGADIAINLDRDLYRVRDVFGSNWVIDINGREREISAKQAPFNLKITPTLKLTESSATIVGFKRVQAYSYANDPSVLLTRGMSTAASTSADLMAVAQNSQGVADAENSHSLGGMAFLAGSDDQFGDTAMMTTAQYAYANSHPTTTTGGFPNASSTAPTTTTSTVGNPMPPDLTVPQQDLYKLMFINPTQQLNVAITQQAAGTAERQTANGNEPAGKIATGGLDAMDVEFDIRSGKPLQNPYVVTMTRFRPPGAKPGMVQNMVYAQSLHPIDEHLSHVHFVEEGLPFGYELLDFQLHIYNRGEEIATNIAADRVELTRDEAFEYVKMEYIGAHQKDTLAAAPAMGKLPADLPSKLGQGKYADAFYVKVSKDGLANEAYADPACTKRIDDPYLDSVVKRIRFKPALNVGKPVDGVATLKLGQLEITLG
jgi:hypothetical protein